MKKKKIIAYFLAAAIAMAAPFGLSVFAESNVNTPPTTPEASEPGAADPAQANPSAEPTESSSSESSSSESSASESSSSESSSSENTVSDSSDSSTESVPTESNTLQIIPPPSSETTTDYLFTFPSETTAEPEPPVETTPEPPVETTPEPPVETTTKPEDIAVETEATTTTTTAATTTTTVAPETAAPEETVLAETIPEETPAEEITVASTDNPSVTTMGSETVMIAPVEGNEPGIPDVAEGDPGGDFITTIILIALGFVAFILVLVMPTIVKKIKRKIVYKY